MRQFMPNQVSQPLCSLGKKSLLQKPNQQFKPGFLPGMYGQGGISITDIQLFPTLTNLKQNEIQTLQCFYGVYIPLSLKMKHWDNDNIKIHRTAPLFSHLNSTLLATFKS